MESPPLPMDVGDINVCLLSAKKKRSTSSPSIRDLDQMSLCSFPSSVSVADELASLGGRPGSANRKRKLPDYDTQSVQNLSFREPSSKKVRRPLSKISLLANKIRESPLMQAKRSIKRSLSFSKDDPSPAHKYRLPGTPKAKNTSTLCRRRSKRLNPAKPHLPSNWIDVVGPDAGDRYTKEEIKRQEAIYSILKTEGELVEDLKMVINIFYHPLLRLRLVSEEEHCKIFGNIQTIFSLHEDLFSKIEELRSDGDFVDAIGNILLEWSSTLSPYAEYCAHLMLAKSTLEAKRQEPAFEDFLQRCLDSDFSRKIDLWTFLDSPRSRIMKYPILLKEVKKKTPSDHCDQKDLNQAISSFDLLIKEIDRCTGVAKCRDVITRLDYLHDDQRCSEIDDSQFVLCSGVLRNKNNSKLNVFLLDKALVLTRPSSRTGTLMYQVYRQPIPVNLLLVESLSDGEGKSVSGSFRGTRTVRSAGNAGGKHLFKVSCSDPKVCSHSYTLQANGDYDKKAWLDSFKTVVPVICNSSPVTAV